jgi:hypothetical protein
VLHTAPVCLHQDWLHYRCADVDSELFADTDREFVCHLYVHLLPLLCLDMCCLLLLLLASADADRPIPSTTTTPHHRTPPKNSCKAEPPTAAKVAANQMKERQYAVHEVLKGAVATARETHERMQVRACVGWDCDCDCDFSD